MPQNYHLEYKDEDGDLVRINNEEDFTILAEDFKTIKSVKIFIKESEEVQTPNDQYVEIINNEFEEYPEFEQIIEDIS